jgi:uncharacterized membrane protein YhaH (DUF805 family)
MDFQALFLTNSGRINRQPYWIGSIILVVVSAIVDGIIAAILGHGFLGQLLVLIVSLILLYASINIGIKRFHDRDKSGWWVLIALVPLIGWIWYLIECGFLPGTSGPNRYGPDPLGGFPA